MGPAPQMGHLPSSRMLPAILSLSALVMPLREAFKIYPFGQRASIFIAIVARIAAWGEKISLRLGDPIIRHPDFSKTPKIQVFATNANQGVPDCPF
jgi:hypothetical protein